MKKQLRTTPGISVVMPVYNVENFIREAVDSILNQSYQDFELIIINDCSTDGTMEQLIKYDDPRIRIIENERNAGNYPSRNRGLQIARGKYIAVMDGDDIAFPERLKIQYEYLENNPDVVLVGALHQLSTGYKLPPEPVDHETLCLRLLFNNCVLHPSLMGRKNLFQEIGGYDERFVYAADYNLMCQAVFKGEVVILPKVLMTYRCHSDQISQAKFSEQALYADQIRKDYQQKFINRYRREDQAEVDQNYLGHPEWGRVIALLTYAEYKEDSCIQDMAAALLGKLFNTIKSKFSIGLERGLCGVGCAIIYLLRNDMVEGNENEVLAFFDMELILYLHNHTIDSEKDYYAILYYLRHRLSEKNKEADKKQYLFVQQILVEVIDALYDSVPKRVVLSERLKVVLSTSEIFTVFPYKIKALLKEEIVFPVSIPSADFKDKPLISFLIPFRMDSEERATNLTVILKQLSCIENAEVIIIEGSEKQMYKEQTSEKNRVNYFYEYDSDPVFHRTKYINRLIHKAASSVVAIWDTDVLIPVCQIMDVIHQVYTGKAVLSYPYNGVFYMLSSMQTKEFLQGTNSIDFLSENESKYTSAIGNNSVGGAYIVNKEIYLDSGGENEHFYGWGMEDLERYKRIEILGLPIYRSSGPLFHLYHPRLQNSCYSDASLEIRNRQEFQKICAMERKDLEKYISQW